jgi:hypothetical protein
MDDRGAGQAGPRLGTLAVDGSPPLGISSHESDSTALKLRVILSI